MKDENKTREQLIDELEQTRREVRELELWGLRLKKAEEELNFSRHQLRSLIDAGPDFFFLKDIDLRYQLINSANARFFGRDEASILGRTDLEMMPDRAEGVACQESDLLAIRGKKMVVTVEQVGDRFYETHKFPVMSGGEIAGVAGIVRDVTDRKRAEEALRRNEELQNTILSNVGAFIYLKDTKYRYTYVNSKVCRLFGFPENEIIGKDDSHFFSTSSVMEILKSDRRVIEHGETITREEADLASQDKIPRTYWAVKIPLKDRFGNIYGLCGISTDITDLKRAEEELRETHRRLDEIIEYLPDATLVIDDQGKVIAWNKAIEQMTGVRAEDILGKGDYEYALPFYGERRPILIDLVLKPRREFEEKYVSTERRDMVLEGEAYMPALRGGEVYLSGKASALKDSKGNIVGAIESIRDITDRRKAEEKYRGIFDNAVMGICQISPDGRILSANPAFARILGYTSPEEVVNTVTDVARQLFVNPQRYEDLRVLIVQASTINLQEIELFRKDGSTILVHVSGRAVRNGVGQPLYFEGTIQDITEISRLETKLRQAQKMEAIGTLAGGIAHDFNNILASMMGYTEMAAKETRENIRVGYLNQVLQACERAKNLVNQILSFSRMREQERRPLDIRLILKEALSLLRASLPTTIEMHQDIAPEEATVLADPTQIHQIIMNLCTNAAHAMHEKGGLLDVRLSRMEIDAAKSILLPDLRPGDYIRLSVRDTGHGIDPAIKDKIFDPFFTTKIAKEGTGLGLSVVYGIVKSYGGAIDVQSSMGQGTIFVIFLPCISGASAKGMDEKNTEVEPDLQGHERLLFVDDEEMLVKMARTYFESLGYSITATTSSSEALRLFQENPGGFDLVITDVTMPELTGTALSAEFLKIRPNLPVILCTGYSDSVNMADVRKQNIREFCLKPISLNDLGRTVRRVLENRAEHRS